MLYLLLCLVSLAFLFVVGWISVGAENRRTRRELAPYYRGTGANPARSAAKATTAGGARF
jgi:hypothetical protein